MTVKSSGTLAITEIRNEFDGSVPMRLSNYYRAPGKTTATDTNIPTSGTIKFSDFYSGNKYAPGSTIASNPLQLTTWTVPLGINSITVTIYGGGGGAGGADTGAGPSGRGGTKLVFTYSVTPGQVFTLCPGSGGKGGVSGRAIAGGVGGTSLLGYNGAAGGKSGPSGASGSGGGGGAASILMLGAAVVAVAGGGGGSGGGGYAKAGAHYIVSQTGTHVGGVGQNHPGDGGGGGGGAGGILGGAGGAYNAGDHNGDYGVDGTSTVIVGTTTAANLGIFPGGPGGNGQIQISW